MHRIRCRRRRQLHITEALQVDRGLDWVDGQDSTNSYAAEFPYVHQFEFWEKFEAYLGSYGVLVNYLYSANGKAIMRLC